MAASKTAA
ncbi:hypothetical protein D049_5076A, partial [Vibrio parahaemolyticus VPTS-2010]